MSLRLVNDVNARCVRWLEPDRGLAERLCASRFHDVGGSNVAEHAAILVSYHLRALLQPPARQQH